MTTINLKTKTLFYSIMLMLVVFLTEVFSFVAFLIIEKEWFSFSKVYSERNSLSYNTDITKLASDEKPYNFLNELGIAKVITNRTDFIGKTE